jgi:hypothetical protein
MHKTLTAVVGMAALLLAASSCGSDTDTAADSGPAVVIDGQAVATDADPSNDSGDDTTDESTDGETTAETVVTDVMAADGADEASEEEMALDFVACMRDNGVDFPDPQVNADGSIVLVPGGPLANGLDPGSTEFQDAVGVCGDLVEGASFLPANSIDQNELEDTLLAFAACVRDKGFEIDDPDLSGGFPPPGGPAALFGDAFDPADPANAEVVAECRLAALNETGFTPPGGA